MPNRVTMTVTNDGACVVSPKNIGRSGELGIGMTVNVDATLATYGTGKYTYIQFITPDGQSFYKGSYDCSSGTFSATMGDSDVMLLLDGDVEIQLVISDTELDNLPVIPNVTLTGNSTPSVVLLGNTFYSNDPLTKETGTMRTIEFEEALGGGGTIGVFDETGTTGAIMLLIPKGYSDGVTSTIYYKDINLAHENIKSGVTIFNILGTYEGE